MNWSKTAISTFVKSAMVAGVSSSILLPNKVFAGPAGGVISQGSGSISVHNKTTTIKQSTSAMVVDWQSFNVAQDELVKFDHPSAKASTLNRIHDQNPSQILGRVEGKGRVFLVNPNGIVFGENSTVNLGSLVATTKQISDSDFMSGNIKLRDVDDEGVIVNRGTLTAATGGSVVLVGDNVVNEGVIQAVKGSVVLASGESATLDFDGDGLLQFKLSGEATEGKTDTAVLNAGMISADDGSVLLTAKAARDVFANVVNNTGVVEAKGIDTSGGKIRLIGEGADVRTSGQLIATSENDTGGQIDVTGDRVAIDDGALLDVSGQNGGGHIRVGGGYQGNDADINNAEKTYVADTATLKADAIESGDGGEVIVWADEFTNYKGSISAKGGSQNGDGGFAEVSGKQALSFTGDVDLTAENGVTGELLLDPGYIEIVKNSGYILDDDVVFDGDTSTTTKIDVDNLVSQLATANVSLQAEVDIDVKTSIDTTGNTGDVAFTNNLTLHAKNDINIDGDISLKTGATLTLRANGDVDGNGNISQSKAITATHLVVDAKNSADLTDQNNNFDTVSLSGGSVNIRDVDGVDLAAADLTGSLTVNAGGNITQSGVVDVASATALTSGADITLDNSNNDFSSISLTAVNAQVNDINALDLAATTLTGLLEVIAENDITQSSAISLNSPASFTSNSGNVILNNPANDFASLGVSALNAIVEDANALILSDTNVAGDLFVITAGNLTQSAAINVGGTTDLDVAGAITLENANNNFSFVNASATNISVRDLDALSVAALNTNNLTITTGGALTQTGAFFVSNEAHIEAASTVFTEGNDFNVLYLNGGSATINDINNVVLGNTDLTHALTVTAVGNITQNAAVEVDGFATLSATNIVLDDSNNDFSSVKLTAVNAQLADRNTLAFGASNIFGALNVAAESHITQSTAISVDGAASFTSNTGNVILGDASNEFSTIGVSALNATIQDVDELALSTSSLSGDLSVITGDNLTQSGAIDVAGAAVLAVSGDITLENAANDFDTLNASGTNISVRDANDLIVEALNTSDLTINAGNAITQTGAFVVSNETNIQAATATLTQDNDFNSLSLSGGTASVNDINGILLDTIDLTGSLTVNSAGNITQNGAVDVDGTTSLTATGYNITLDNGNNDFSSLSLTAVDAQIEDASALVLASTDLTGTLAVTAEGNITQTAAVEVDGAASFTSNSGDVTLNHAGNDFSSLGVSAANATVVDVNAVELSSSSVTGDLSVTAGGNLTQSGAIDVAGATVLAVSGDITLENAANDFDTLDASGTNISVRDENDLSVAALNTTNLTITTGGALTQTGAFVVSSTANIEAATATLTQDNDFTSLALNGGSVTVNDLNDVVLGTTDLTGNLTVTSAGNITQSGDVEVDGATSLTAAGDITLDNSGNDFASLALDAVNSVVQDSTALELAVTTIINALTVTSAGDLTQSGAIDVNGATVLAVTGDITLENTANDLTSLDVTASTSSNMSVTDTNDLSVSAVSVDDLSLTTGGVLTQTGAFVVSNNAVIDANTATLTQDNDFATLSLAGGSANVTDINAIELGVTDLSGTLTVTAGGNITQSGIVEVDGVANLSATGSDIVLDNVANDFSTVTVQADTLELADKNDVSLAALTVDNLALVVAGALTQSGVFDVQNGADIQANTATLNLDNDFNSLALSGGSISIKDINGFALGATDLTGDLTIDTVGTLSQIAEAKVDGLTDLTATTIILSEDNDFTDLALSAQDATVKDINALRLDTSSLTGFLSVNTGGDLTQNGAVTVAGSTIFASVGQSIDLQNSSNDFNTVTAVASTVSLNDSNDLILNGLTVDDLAVTVVGTLTQTGAFIVNNLADITGNLITLGQANDFNSLALAGGNVTVNEVDELNLDSVNLTGSLTLTTGGNLSQSGTVNVDGNTDLDVSGVITLLDSNNDFSTVDVIANELHIRDAGDLSLSALNVDELTVITAGQLTQTGVFDIANSADITAATSILTQNNDFNTLALAGGSATITEANGVLLEASDLTGNLTLNVAGALSQLGAVSVDGTTDLTASSISLTQSNDFATLQLASGDTTITNSGGFNLGWSHVTGDLNLMLGGDLTQSDALQIDGTTSITAPGFDIYLQNIGNDFNSFFANASELNLVDKNDLSFAGSFVNSLDLDITGDLTQTDGITVNDLADISANTVFLDQPNNFNQITITASSALIEEANDIDLLSQSITGDFTLTAGGDITQSEALSFTGNVIIQSTDGDVILNNRRNDFASLSIIGGHVSVTDQGDLALPSLDVSTLTIDIDGHLTQTGAFVVTDQADLTAATINLDLLNDFNKLGLNATTATINEINGFTLTDSTIAGALTITAMGDVEQTAAINVAGHTNIDASGNAIILQNAANDFSTIELTAIDARLSDSNDLIVSSVIVDQLMLDAADTLSQTGEISVTNGSDISASVINLNLGNDFNELALQGREAIVNDINDLSLGLTNLSGDMTVTAVGTVSQGASTTVLGNTDITAAVVNLQHADNDFNTFSATASEVYLRDTNDISVDSLTVDELSLRTDGTLTQTGAFTVANLAEVHVDSAALDQANDFNRLSINGGSIEVNDINQLDIATSSLTGTASITTAGSVSQSGGLIADHIELNATGHNVELNHVDNDFDSFAVNAETVAVSNSSDLEIAASTIGQSLSITATGDVTQSESLDISTFEIDASGFDVNLTNSNNDFDSLAVTANTATIVDQNGISLAASQVTSEFDLTANGSVTQTAALNTGLLDVTAVGQTVELSNANNQLGAVSLQADDATLVSTGNLSVQNVTLTNSLDLTVAGDVTQNGVLMVPELFINTGSNDLTLTNAGNRLDRISVRGNQARVRDNGSLELMGVNVSDLSIAVDDSLTQSSGTTIKASDRLTVTANQIVLNQANKINSVALSGTNAELTNAANLELRNIDLNNFFLNVSGSVSNTVASNIQVNNDFVVSNSGNISLGKVAGDNVNFGAITLDSKGVTIREDSDILLKDVTASSLTLRSTGDVKDNGDLSISGTLTVDAQGDIELGSFGQSEVTKFGAISLKADNIRVIEEDSMMIHRAKGDVVELFSEKGAIYTNGTKIVAKSVLTLDAGPNKDIGSPDNLVNFILNRTGSLTLDARNAYLTQSAADFSRQVALFNSNALIRSEANLVALTRSEVQFLSYLLGVDEALFNEFVTIFDVQEDGMLLPEDQREEELSWFSNDGRYLVSVDKNEKFEDLHDMWVKYGEIFTVLAMDNSKHNLGLM
ncbi:filamentous hemagglutinin N-terminal domain-containing protein [Neptuniibacter sp. QD57_21]|uniref:two-partner secretion domain-containing protein n=1 Tax=Neptuniibacter sp. QD57_21 TaxID=3398213 RepID=UPI0039F4972D